MKHIYPKYNPIILSLILLVFSHQAIAQRPSLDSVPPIVPFSINSPSGTYPDAEHISDYTWKKYDTININKVFQLVYGDKKSDTSRIITYTKDGWMQNTVEHWDGIHNSVTELKEVQYLDNRFILKIELKSINDGFTTSLVKFTKEFNQLGLLEKSVAVFKEFTDTNFYLTQSNEYRYDKFNNVVYYKLVEKGRGPEKVTINLDSNKFRYFYLHDTLVSFVYRGVLDSVKRKGKNDFEYYVQGYPGSFQKIYIYYYDKNGKFLGFQDFRNRHVRISVDNLPKKKCPLFRSKRKKKSINKYTPENSELFIFNPDLLGKKDNYWLNFIYFK